MKFSHGENEVVSCDNDVCFANEVKGITDKS